MKFSTPDNDNDESSGNCAAGLKSGNWYKSCRHIGLNQQPPVIYPHGNIIFAEMKICPKDCAV